MADPIRRLHALFGVFRYARLLSSPPTATDADTNTAVMTDRRIVLVTGPLVHSDILSKVLWFVGESIEGVHVKTIPIITDACNGMVVNSSETLMAVTCCASGDNGNKLYLYSMPGGELLRTIGGARSHEPGEFCDPRRVCFGPDDVIIVTDIGNNRLQEFSSSGEYKRSIAVRFPCSVCVSHDGRYIGVGTGAVWNWATMTLLDYMSGTLIRGTTKRFSHTVSSVQFTSDDVYILAAVQNLTCVKMFSVADGSIVRDVCEGEGTGTKDVCFAASGDIVVRCEGSGRICVFDADGAVLLKQFGRQGTGDGEFMRPTSMCCVNGRLYVLDFDSPRVQVFE